MIIILIVILFLLMTIVIGGIGSLFLALYRRRLNMDEYALHLEQDPVKARELLSKLVEDALLDWSVLHVRTEEEAYISDSRREECLIWVIDKVVRETTLPILNQIGIGYPASDRAEYIDSVKKVASMHVMKFCITQNANVLSDAKNESMQNINIDG